MNVFSLLFSFLAGIVGSMGLGGGSILIIYLSSILFMEQTKAQGINVLFFIPCAIYALIYYFKEKLIIKEAILPLLLSGIVGVLIGLKLVTLFNTVILSKLFGGFLIILSIKELVLLIKNRSAINN